MVRRAAVVVAGIVNEVVIMMCVCVCVCAYVCMCGMNPTAKL